MAISAPQAQRILDHLSQLPSRPRHYPEILLGELVYVTKSQVLEKDFQEKVMSLAGMDEATQKLQMKLWCDEAMGENLVLRVKFDDRENAMAVINMPKLKEMAGQSAARSRY